MQLAISALGNNSTHFINKILDTVSSCNCHVQSLRSSCLAQTTASYLLVTGNWNQIAKLETQLISLQKKLEIQIHTLRADTPQKNTETIPYSLETISLSPKNIIERISTFLFERAICIEEINASYYYPSYIQTPVFSVKFILSVPTKTTIRTLRDDLHNFADTLNIDTIFDPIK